MVKLECDRSPKHRGYMLVLLGGVATAGIILLTQNGAHIQFTVSVLTYHIDLSFGVNNRRSAP